MDRRRFIVATASALVGNMPSVGAGQQQIVKIYRIGFLGIPSADQFASRVAAFRAGLHDRGYIEGKNLLIEFRWADGDDSRLPGLAAELVRLNVDVITQRRGTCGQACNHDDSHRNGGRRRCRGCRLAVSLSRPGGNLTGSNILIPELNVKRLELLKEALARIRRVAIHGP